MQTCFSLYIGIACCSCYINALLYPGLTGAILMVHIDSRVYLQILGTICNSLVPSDVGYYEIYFNNILLNLKNTAVVYTAWHMRDDLSTHLKHSLNYTIWIVKSCVIKVFKYLNAYNFIIPDISGKNHKKNTFWL